MLVHLCNILICTFGTEPHALAYFCIDHVYSPYLLKQHITHQFGEMKANIWPDY